MRECASGLVDLGNAMCLGMVYCILSDKYCIPSDRHHGTVQQYTRIRDQISGS